MARNGSQALASDSAYTVLFEAGSPSAHSALDGPAVFEFEVERTAGSDNIEIQVWPTSDPKAGADTAGTSVPVIILDSTKSSRTIADTRGITKMQAKLASGGTSATIRWSITIA
jgi:hypothetical protein